MDEYTTRAGRADGGSASDERWREGIAIVGMGARFPGCASVEEYWENLARGKNLLSEPSDSEMRAAGVDPETADQLHFVRSGTRLEAGEDFDARFFDVTRREAEIMDPQQRIFLECAYHAMEHAGLRGEGERVGVFAGIGMNTYLLQLLGNPELLASAGGYQLMLGNDKDFLATRVAYKLNLRGPAVVIQTACSTSLAAVHLACKSLLAGECDSALAGGVSVMFPQVAGYSYIPGMILSPDGYCRPFDSRARGTVPGKGAGVVVLKRLSDALAGGDAIYAVIAGSAWNNDGSGKVGYSAPSVDGQASVIRAAHAAAGATPDRFSYIEAHGTGTELGDPIEVAALAEVFGGRREKAGRCVLGSVKANMGHADVAAGVAGLIKATLALHHGLIPPTPHFERANPDLGLEKTPFEVSAKAESWPAGEAEHWAGVSSFGIGGTNVHLCLRSAPEIAEEGAAGRAGSGRAESGRAGSLIFPFSAKTASALEASVERFADFVAANPGLDLVAAAATLQEGRRAYSHRRAVVAEGRDEVLEALRKPAKARPSKGASSLAGQGGEVAFLFPGQGLQFPALAAELYARDTGFRERIEAGLAVLGPELAGEIREYICGVPAARGAEEAATLATSLAQATGVAQPLLLLVEYALAQRWMELGVKPAVLLGHSLGELTAATVAGVFSFEDGLRLAAERGRLMQETPPGAMLAVSLGVENIGAYLTAELWIAAENGPKLTVISGSAEAIEDAARRFSAARVASVRVRTDRAFHTPQMAEASSKFHDRVAAVERHAPVMRWLSNVSGTWITPEEAMSAQYWADQMTARVRFSENAAMVAAGGYFLLETGPGDALATLVRQHDRGLAWASSLGAGRDAADGRGGDCTAFSEAAARLWERGAGLDWRALDWKAGVVRGLEEDRGRRVGRVALPLYPFERERYWVEATQAVGVASSRSGDEPTVDAGGYKASEKRADLACWFYSPTWQRTPQAGLIFPRPLQPIKTWVVLDDGTGFGELLAERLEAAGAKVLIARFGVGQGRPGTACGPGKECGPSKEDCAAFWKQNRDAVSSGGIGLISCWSLRGAGVQPLESLLALMRSAQIARVRFAQIEVLIDELVEINGESVEAVERAQVEGFARVIPAEFLGVLVRVIDPGKIRSGEIDGPLVAQAVESVCAEVMTTPQAVATGTPTVAYRAGSRWQEVWQPVRLEPAEGSRLRVGGTYVVTGGLGGVGHVLARHLVSQYGARVALIGRTEMPRREHWEEWLTEHGPGEATSRRIRRVQELERLGGEVMALRADVADGSQLEAVWAEIEARFGAVHGVIHAAGLPGGARIAAQDLVAVAEVNRAKVDGSRALAELLHAKSLQGRKVDFLFFCSSISSIAPLVGASVYAAGNAFQDRFAVWCRQRLGLPAMAVNFDAWQEVGMAADSVPTSVEQARAKDFRMRKAMLPEEGIEVFERALRANEAQILVSAQDFPTFLFNALQESNSPILPGNSAPISSVAAHGKGARSEHGQEPGSEADELSVQAARQSEETAAVIAIWKELLGADRVEATDNFFELGGHSLLGTMVLARIREQFGTELSIRSVFEAPTPATLGDRIRQARVEEPAVVLGEREEFEI